MRSAQWQLISSAAKKEETENNIGYLALSPILPGLSVEHVSCTRQFQSHRRLLWPQHEAKRRSEKSLTVDTGAHAMFDVPGAGRNVDSSGIVLRQ